MKKSWRLIISVSLLGWNFGKSPRWQAEAPSSSPRVRSMRCSLHLQAAPMQLRSRHRKSVRRALLDLFSIPISLFRLSIQGRSIHQDLRGRPLPFTWEPARMAKYMVDCALKGKSRCEPSIFYAILTRLLRVLPDPWAMNLLKNL